MTKALHLDLKKLKARAFDRAEWAEEVLRKYHAAIPNLHDAVAQQLRTLYVWMFVPPTLWPFNIQDVLELSLTKPVSEEICFGDCSSAPFFLPG